MGSEGEQIVPIAFRQAAKCSGISNLLAVSNAPYFAAVSAALWPCSQVVKQLSSFKLVGLHVYRRKKFKKIPTILNWLVG